MTGKLRRRTVHPFPARMAPDVALDKIESLTTDGALVLDPMCGSGTVPRLAAEEGRRAVGCDLDPLAVMITRTACRPAWSENMDVRAQDLVRTARLLTEDEPDWIKDDEETAAFVRYWFADSQRAALGRLAQVLVRRPVNDDPLRVALSRLIVTKEGGASLARDTSHSRPHRVKRTNDFDVYAEFIKAAARIEATVASESSKIATVSVSIRSVDARALAFVERASVDLVVTSPPYLNAIDYLRGHRLSLVWLGWRLDTLRGLRGEVIGAERGLRSAKRSVAELAEAAVPRLKELRPKDQAMVWRYANDMDRLCRSLGRVAKPGGHLVFVVADSQLRGVPVPNSTLCKIAAQRHGFEFVEGIQRPLPTQHRYLPPPESLTTSALRSRMREEAVLTFRRSS